MRADSWSGLLRFLRVLKLFFSIFWTFYSLKFKKLWHSQSWIEAQKEKLYASQAHRFRTTAVDMGGLLIKLGQFFSTRVDILPPATIQELSLLQDEVLPVSFEEIQKVIEREFASSLPEVFASVNEEPIAAASLGQVHQGMLKDGRTVAIKILRPGIEDLVDIDLRAVQAVLNAIKRFTNWGLIVDFDAIYKEFADTVREELDYVQEGKNAEIIAANNHDPDIVIPSIMWDYTTKRVLTMEYVQGIKITDYEALKEAGIDLREISHKLLKTYIEQILVNGFYHADPHPGNLFASSSGKLIMLDFGMVGSVPPKLRDTLLEMVLAMVKRDYLEVVKYFKVIGLLRYDADNETVSRAVEIFLEQVLGSGVDLSQTDLNKLLDDLEKLLYEQPFQLPANFTFLGRALGTLYGICVGLNPEINFLDEARPYLDKFMEDDKDIWQLIKDRTTLWGTSLLELPPLSERVLRRAERGDLNVNVPLRGISEAIENNTRAVNLLAWALSFGFSLATSAYLLVNQYENVAAYGFIFSALLFLLMLKNSRGRVKRRKAPHPPVMVRRGSEDPNK